MRTRRTIARGVCMRYRELGRTGLEVSEIGFGAEWMEKKSAAEVRAVVER